MENIMGHFNYFMQEIQQYITIFYLWSVLVHSPLDRPHLIMLFCFLISRNAKCLCHLWTAKRANLGFSLIATVTSLLCLRRGLGGWVGGNAWQEEDCRKEGWKDGDTALLTHGWGVKERGRPTERSLEESNSGEWGDSLRCERAPTPSWEGGGFSSGQLCSLNFAGEMTVLSRAIAGHHPDTDTYLPQPGSMSPTHQTQFSAILLIDTFIFVWNETCSCVRQIGLTNENIFDSAGSCVSKTC